MTNKIFTERDVRYRAENVKDLNSRCMLKTSTGAIVQLGHKEHDWGVLGVNLNPGEVYTVGRSKDNRLIFKDSEQVSRQHGEILQLDGWCYADKSRNGSVIVHPSDNEERSMGRQQVVEMKDGIKRVFNVEQEGGDFIGAYLQSVEYPEISGYNWERLFDRSRIFLRSLPKSSLSPLRPGVYLIPSEFRDGEGEIIVSNFFEGGSR